MASGGPWLNQNQLWPEQHYKTRPGVTVMQLGEPPAPAMTLAAAWRKCARDAQEDLAHRREQQAVLAEAHSCMHWNRLRRKWATKHARSADVA